MDRLTPLEIQRATFPRRLKGFDQNAVRDFLAQVAEQEEEDNRLRAELKAQVVRLTREVEEHRGRGTAMNEALLSAQRTAEATITNAQLEAQRIVGEAQALAERVIEEATERAQNVELVISQLRTRRRAIRTDVKRLVELLLGVLRDDEADESRDGQVSTIALLRRRQREAKHEP